MTNPNPHRDRVDEASHAPRTRRAALALAGLLAIPIGASAANGFRAIGVGAESLGMGGADTALARDTAALQSNPAGLVQLRHALFDVHAGVVYLGDIRHRDALGNDMTASNRLAGLAGLGYAAPIDDRITAGIGLFTQGGYGVSLRDMNTPFGTRDGMRSRVGFAALMVGLGWRATDTLSLGVTLPWTAMRSDQRLFPSTSVAAAPQPFFGVDLDGAQGGRLGLRLGAMWTPDSRSTIGLTYATRTPIEATGGRADVDMTAVGLGNVRYRSVRQTGVGLPAELAVGVSWRTGADRLWSLKLARLQWSRVMEDVGVKLGRPSVPGAPQTLELHSHLGWRDQTVVAIGHERLLTPQWTLRVGFNWARNPVPPQTMTPLLPAIVQSHGCAGLAYRLDSGWTLSATLEYARMHRVRYTNPDFPVTAGGAQARVGYVAALIGLSYAWDER